jgi:hypothetical protein
LLDLFIDPEDGGEMFLRNVGWLRTDYIPENITLQYWYGFDSLQTVSSQLRPIQAYWFGLHSRNYKLKTLAAHLLSSTKVSWAVAALRVPSLVNSADYITSLQFCQDSQEVSQLRAFVWATNHVSSPLKYRKDCHVHVIPQRT